MDAAPVIIVVGLALVLLVVIIVAPSRRVRAERPLPEDVQARVLLGESPAQIESEIESEIGSEPPAHEHPGDAEPSVPPTAS